MPATMLISSNVKTETLQESTSVENYKKKKSDFFKILFRGKFTV
jgi:hypothetical protein